MNSDKSTPLYSVGYDNFWPYDKRPMLKDFINLDMPDPTASSEHKGDSKLQESKKAQ